MALQVDPSNAGISEGWNGRDGRHWAEHAEMYDRAIAAHHDALFAHAAIQPTDAVLDVGCGNGFTTLTAARAASSGSVVGVDISAPMLEIARGRTATAGLTNVDFVHADAQIHPFPESTFDVVISRFGVMFFGDPAAAFANIAGAVKPGGRLAMVVWQSPARNDYFTKIPASLFAGRPVPPPPPPGTPGPFALADPDRTRALIESSGFTDVELIDHAAPMRAGTDLDETFAFVNTLSFVHPLLEGLDDETRPRALAELRGVLESHVTADGVVFDSASWIITGRRT